MSFINQFSINFDQFNSKYHWIEILVFKFLYKYMKHLYVFFIILAHVQSSSFTAFEVTCKNYQIRQVTDNYMSVKPYTTLPSGSQFKVIYPSAFTNLPSGTVSCSFTGITGGQCQFSGNTLYITNFTPSNSPTLTFTISSITNPTYAGITGTFQIYSLKSDGTILDSTTSGVTLNFTPLSMGSVTLSTENQIVASPCKWTFDATINNSVGSNGAFVVSFPSWNSQLGAADTEIRYFCDGTVTCTGVTNLPSSLPCTCSKGIATITLSSGLSASRVVFTISPILNPPSTDVFTGIIVSTSYSGGLIEQSSSLSVQMTKSTTLEIYSMWIDDEKVGAQAIYYFYTNCSAPVISTYNMQITFPTGEITATTGVTTVEGVIWVNRNNLVYTISNDVLTLTGPFTQYIDWYKSIEFQVLSLSNPPSTKPTQQIQIKISTSNGGTVCSTTSTTGYSMTATPSTISSISITPSDKTIDASTSYAFSFTPVVSILSGSVITITVPSQVSISDKSASFISSITSGLDSNAQYSVASNAITISSGFPSQLAASSVISFSLSDLTNPPTTATSSVFTITIYSDSTLDYSEVNDQSATVTATSGSLQSVTVTPSSYTTGDSSTSYTFLITTGHKIVAGGQVLISFPSDVSIVFSTATCSNPIGFSSGYSCSFTSSSVTITYGFPSDFPQGQIGITVSSITNPGTTKPTNTFSVTSSYQGSLIDTLTSGITIAMTQAHLLTSASFTLGSTTVGATADLKVAISPYNSMASGSYALITPPSQIEFPSSPTCVSQSSNLQSVSCSISGSALKAAFTLASTSTSEIDFSIKNVVGPPSTKPTDTFSIFTYISGYSIDYISSGVFVSASTPATMVASVTPTNTGIAQTTSYTFTLNTLHTVASGGYVIIVFPSQVSYSGITCTYNSQAVSCEDKGSNTIWVSPFASDFTAGKLTFIVNNVENYSQPGTSGAFQITTMTSDNYKIDYSGSAAVTFTCALPKYSYQNNCVDNCPDGTYANGSECSSCATGCATCSGSSTNCLTCSQGYYFYQNTCVDTCPSDITIVSGSNCISCQSPCKTCSDSITHCNSCTSGYYLYKNACTKTCPTETTVIVGSSCVDCQSPCSTCSLSITNCTSCTTKYYLHQNSCLDSCPKETTITNGTDCLDCESPCSTCSESITNCTLCISGYYYYKNTCLQTCPTSTTVPSGTSCVDCQSPCSTCSSSITSCTSCISGMNLYGNQCVSTCPDGYTSISSICQQCSTKCKTCSQTIDTCTSCYSGDHLDNITCSPDYSTTLLLDTVPFPVSTSGTVLSGISAASKVLFPSTGMTSGTLAMWGVIEPISWIGVIGGLSSSTSTHGRTLLATDEFPIYVPFILLLSFLVLHVLLNLIFCVIYYHKIFKKDDDHRNWLSLNRIAKMVIVPLAVVFSFKFIRMLDVKLFNLKCFTAEFTTKAAFYKPLILFSYVSLLSVNIPVIGTLCYILIEFSTGNIVYVLALDSLIFNILVFMITIIDIFMMNMELNKELKVMKDSQMATDNNFTINTMRDAFAETMEDLTLTNFASIKIKNAELENMGDLEYTQLGGIMIKNASTEAMARNASAETMVKNASAETLDDIIYAEEASFKVNYEDMTSAENLNENEIFIGYGSGAQVWTMSFQHESETNVGLIPLPPVKPVYRPPPPNILETIPEESVLDLTLSEMDIDDKSIIKVPHIPSGKNIKVRKSFDGAEILDLESIDENPQLVDQNLYSIERVNPNDARFGTLKEIGSNKLITAKRNFAGATVVDVETEDGKWLIGKHVSKEEDFDFANAIEDPKNPEAVLVTHKRTGVKCRVKKGFKGLPRLDKKTNLPLFREKIIDTYDIDSVFVDPKNSHYANLVSDGKEIRARRNFIGGNILDVLTDEEFEALKAEMAEKNANRKREKKEKELAKQQEYEARIKEEQDREKERKAKWLEKKAKAEQKAKEEEEARLAELQKEENEVMMYEIPNLEQNVDTQANTDTQAFVFNKDGYEEEPPAFTTPQSKMFTETFLSNSSKKAVTPEGISSLEAIYLQRLEPAKNKNISRPKKKGKKLRHFSPFMNPTTEDSLLNQIEDSVLNQLNIGQGPADLDFELIRRKTDNV
ncbi:unnamed protein product [Blepharisma stoltei]|uniref:EGF-like domain-containing protein n=1 Tax=Blepharisma stoltei TaxID=1481888 RepID=A0AAU9JU29_9CILI|nr:unnamed protein product [Blepharisma stoltei]